MGDIADAMISASQMIYAFGILGNGYYIMFSRSENISYGKAVYHISSEIYHFYAPKKTLFSVSIYLFKSV